MKRMYLHSRTIKLVLLPPEEALNLPNKLKQSQLPLLRLPLLLQPHQLLQLPQNQQVIDNSPVLWLKIWQLLKEKTLARSSEVDLEEELSPPMSLRLKLKLNLLLQQALDLVLYLPQPLTWPQELNTLTWKTPILER